jgi:hypothetical protein
MSYKAKNELELLRDALLLTENRCFGRKIELYHDLPDDLVDEEEMPLYAKIRSVLPELINRVENEVRAHEENRDFHPRMASDPKMIFEDIDHRDDPEVWNFTVHRTDWEDFEYCLVFRGAKFEQGGFSLLANKS